ncbi:MAG TPA: amidohydrolase family protein [Terriglobales bacterium]|nr:amidohydrolase family protein [Terriglobales bacterium]
MQPPFSRRQFLGYAGSAAIALLARDGGATPRPNAVHFGATLPNSNRVPDRIVDIHVHFDEKNPHFIDDLLKVSERLNMTACVLTPYPNRSTVADAAKRYPTRVVPFGFVDLDAPDAVQQVKEFHRLGYSGLGELEFVKKLYTDSAYMPVYELANEYGWVVLFHTGIVLRKNFNEPEDVASYRMRAFYLEEIARRFPRITVIGAHCGNPEYEWAAEVARWNPNVFFDLSGSTLTKMRDRLSEFQKIFWWSGSNEGTKSPDNDPSAFAKLVFGSDTHLNGIEGVVSQYRNLFAACGVPEQTQKLIMGGTLARILRLAS